MSHFCVAVATKTGKESEISKILEPYWEELEVAPHIYRTKKQMIIEGKETQKRVKEEDEKKEKNESWKNDEWVQKVLNAKTDEDFYLLERDEECYSYDEEGNEFTTYNPNSKWDWYVVGGRFRDALPIKEGGHVVKVNVAKIKDIHFDLAGKDKEDLKRFWEIIVEGDEPRNEKETKMVEENMWKPQYYIDTYETKENYIKTNSTFYPWAFVNETRWYEQGKMGWWAMSDATSESIKNFTNFFDEYVNSPEHQDEYLTIVDCHI